MDKTVYVYLIERDSNGCLISKKKYPIDHIFVHRDGSARIRIEKSKEIEE